MPWNSLINSPPQDHTQSLAWILSTFIITPCWGAACSLSDNKFSSVPAWNIELFVERQEFLLPRWSSKACGLRPHGTLVLWADYQNPADNLWLSQRTWCLLSKMELLAYQSRPLDSKATMKNKKKTHFLHFPEKTGPRCDMWAKILMPTFTHTTGTRRIIVIH